MFFLSLTPRSEKVDPVRYQVPALWGVKRARDHLPIYKLDLPDPVLGVPELKKINLVPKNPKVDFYGVYFLRVGVCFVEPSIHDKQT